jgi:hypothetical protein
MMKKILVVVLSVFAFSVSMVSYGGESSGANYCWDTTNYPHFPAASNPWIKGEPTELMYADCANVCAINEECWKANYWCDGVSPTTTGGCDTDAEIVFDLRCKVNDRLWDIRDLIATFVFVTPLGCTNN